ncbi:MAG: AMP-binding protein, partial [Rikenellaceae bacterium]|nr:AMP-binding protein [Rikenellaceae bacterium]
FPFTVGYGMTECAPLISYSYHKQFVPGSVGRPLPGLMEVRIEKATPDAATGEILVRGENVMLGYYRNEEATAAVFTEDGWMRTGDLGYMDDEGNIFIKGRSKTMLLGSNGENIYPEAIESKLDNLPLVAECIVLQRGERLVALVHPDYATAEQMRLDKTKIPQIMDDNLKTLNSMLARYEQVAAILISEEPFPMTPKRTVKRYLVEKAFAERPSDFV